MGDRGERESTPTRAQRSTRISSTELLTPEEESRELEEPHPLLFGFLILVPYVCLSYHKLHGEVDVFSLIKNVLVSGVHLAATVIFILLCIKIYFNRDRLFDWLAHVIHRNTGLVLHVPPEVSHASVGVQTENTDFQRQAENLKHRHIIEMRTLKRHIRQMRSKFGHRVRTLKDMSKQRNNILTKLQLKFPEVQHERETLVAEREAIEKQLEEEKRRNKELIGRFQRISQQFSRIGHAQYPPPLMSLDFHGVSKVQ